MTEFTTPPESRVFIQEGGTRPGEAYQYLGEGEVGDATISLGDREVIRRQSRAQRGKWDVIGSKFGVPELHTTTLRISMPRTVRSVLERIILTGCPFNLQMVISKCERPDEFNTGWESKILYEAATLSELTVPGLAAVDGTGNSVDEIFQEGSLQFEYFDRILSMRFNTRAGDEILAETVDGTYCGIPSCGDCGPESDGCDHLYVITRANAGSPGLSGQLVYTIDGTNFLVVDIPTLGGLDPDAIACVGDFIVVISEAANNLQYAQRVDAITAADWVEVTTGFVAAHGPRDIYVKSPAEVFIAGAAGYVYEAEDYQSQVTVIEDGTLTAEDFNAIHGDGGNVIVVVGDNNVILLSTNNGETFGLLTGPLAGSDLQAIAVIDAQNWVIGGDGGAFYYTNDGGTTFTAIPFVGAGVGAIIHDVEFSEQTAQVGYMAAEIGGAGYVYRTTDAGTRWFRTEPAIQGLEVNDRVTWVAPCPHDINVVAAGGLDAGGTDGFLAIAE